jgi:hypothetical protein
VKSRWEAGEIGPDTLAWRPGMGDWAPISSIPEMAQYLAPVARGGAKPQPAAVPAAAAAPVRGDGAARGGGAIAAAHPSADPEPASNGASKDEWHPAAASALAALASEELKSLSRPEPKAAASPGPAPVAAPEGGSLLERMDLPDGGVDPTNVMPLPIRGLETTGEKALKTKAPPPDTTQIRELKKTTTRSLVYVVAAMAVLFAIGIAVVVVMMRPPAREPAVAAAPASVRSGIRMACAAYGRILDRAEAARYDVLGRRVGLRPWHLPAIVVRGTRP